MWNSRQNSRVVIAALVPAEGEENRALIEKVTKNIEASGATVLATLIQRRGVSRANKPGGSKMLDRPMSLATLIGSGKVQELAFLVNSTQAEMVVFCNLLTPRQQTNLEKSLKVPVISYTTLMI
jgi:50S ribosomal subunit-associated GTPase HflX